jgi:TRAP-type C4-dicarboxylate transport system substrate-binding protein
VKSFKDFKNLKIAAPDEVKLKLLKALGAVPVSISSSDRYMALQTGTIDAVLTNIDSSAGLKLQEPAPYTFTSKKMGIWVFFSYTMNQEVWDSFSPMIQDQINNAIEKVEERYIPMYEEYYEKTIEDLRNGREGVITIASDEEVQTWYSLPVLEEIEKELAERAEKIGIDGNQFIEDVKRILKEASLE